MKTVCVLVSAMIILACSEGCNTQSKRMGIREKDRYYGNPSKRHRYPVNRLTADPPTPALYVEQIR